MSNEQLLHQLKSRRITDRLEALQRMVRTGDASWASAFLECLKDRSNLVVATAVKGLRRICQSGHYERYSLIGPIVDTYWSLAQDGSRNDPGCIARIEIVSALNEWEAIEAHDVYFHAIETVQIERSGNGLEDMAIPLRIEAAVALGRLRPPGAFVALTLALFDVDPKVDLPLQERPFATVSLRKTAARALGMLGDSGGVAVLVLRLKFAAEELDEVLIECMDALVALDNDVAITYLTPMLYGSNEALVVGAATALVHVENESHDRVVALLMDAVEKTSEKGRIGIALALASMRSHKGEEGLDTLLSHSDENVRLAGVQGWAYRGGNEAIERLANLSERDDSPDVRAMALDVLTSELVPEKGLSDL